MLVWIRYNKAVWHYTKGMEHRKDYKPLWTNRALAYIKLRRQLPRPSPLPLSPHPPRPGATTRTDARTHARTKTQARMNARMKTPMQARRLALSRTRTHTRTPTHTHARTHKC
jgi:hypothetical protein